ncbi:hypothetical protein GDO86_001043 [Hymenochirus boettgeri]|uniref:Microtubule-associated protein 1B/S N-terminal domain-containing protein n=1 Tax=Hymenochirus boettgeri TaxID=247094 RepID=A0A8T2KGK3_9PIPI|nr:hypothetical protein GDO86_001043 [Hymenochirus boettgeri]
MAATRVDPGSPGCSVVVLYGEIRRGPGLVSRAVNELKRGFCSWDVNPSFCNLDEQLKLFVSRHSASFSSEVNGQRSLHHAGEELETLIIINPSKKSVCEEIHKLICSKSQHKLLIFSGPFLEDTGEILLQGGGNFIMKDFIQIFADKESLLVDHNISLVYHYHHLLLCMWTLHICLGVLELIPYRKIFSSRCVPLVISSVGMMKRRKRLPEEFLMHFWLARDFGHKNRR